MKKNLFTRRHETAIQGCILGRITPPPSPGGNNFLINGGKTEKLNT